MVDTTYKTKDLAEAAALMVIGQSLKDIEREAGVCWFVFSGGQQSQDISNKYYFGELLVNARDYQEAMKRLKNLIFTRN